jgi:MFS transporter, Spinster family, sphingosine-1-phosphate transporter
VSEKKASPLFGLIVLTSINLMNYLDRYLLAGALPKVKAEFDLTGAQAGTLASMFILIYTVMSPIGGFLGDRMPRRYLIAGAIFIWSFATVGSGFATTFTFLLVARMLTGVGEAGYGTVAPAFLSDLFPAEKRARILAWFYTAIPLGAAAGFVLGGAMAGRGDWRHAFFIGGAPGLLLAIGALFLPEPERGAMDGAEGKKKIPFGEGLKALAGNTRFWISTAALTLMTFSIGGLGNWMTTFLVDERAFTPAEAGLSLGATTIVGGFVGTIVGGLLGDKLEKRRAGGGVWLSAIGLTAAAPFMILSTLMQSRPLLLGALVLAQVLIFLNQGPLNASVVNAVPPGFRAFAVGLCTLTLHLLGDAASPTIIGAISDASSLARAIQLNAVPVLAAGIVLFVGLKHYRTPAASPAPAPAQAA